VVGDLPRLHRLTLPAESAPLWNAFVPFLERSTSGRSSVRRRGFGTGPAALGTEGADGGPPCRYDRPMAETEGTLQEQLDEIGVQLSWVRDYL
jgi:hypothetical protein